MKNDPVVIFFLILAFGYISLEVYFGLLRLQDWAIHKAKLLRIAIHLIGAKDKQIKAIGWETLKLVFWESKKP